MGGKMVYVYTCGTNILSNMFLEFLISILSRNSYSLNDRFWLNTSPQINEFDSDTKTLSNLRNYTSNKPFIPTST